MPNRVFFSLTCLDFTEANVSMGDNPEFSAKAIGTVSRAFAKALIAYCSIPGLFQLAVFISSGHLISRFRDGQRASYFSSATSIDNTVIFHKISNHAQRVVKCPFGFINNLEVRSDNGNANHLVASSDEYGNSASIGTLLNDEHPITSSSKLQFANNSSMAEFLRR